jgi:hypothetical protein
MGNALHTQAAAVRADGGTTSGHYIPFFPSSIENKTIPFCRDSSARFFPSEPDFIDISYTDVGSANNILSDNTEELFVKIVIMKT